MEFECGYHAPVKFRPTLSFQVGFLVLVVRIHPPPFFCCCCVCVIHRCFPGSSCQMALRVSPDSALRGDTTVSDDTREVSLKITTAVDDDWLADGTRPQIVIDGEGMLVYIYDRARLVLANTVKGQFGGVLKGQFTVTSINGREGGIAVTLLMDDYMSNFHVYAAPTDVAFINATIWRLDQWTGFRGVPYWDIPVRHTAKPGPLVKTPDCSVDECYIGRCGVYMEI